MPFCSTPFARLPATFSPRPQSNRKELLIPVSVPTNAAPKPANASSPHVTLASRPTELRITHPACGCGSTSFRSLRSCSRLLCNCGNCEMVGDAGYIFADNFLAGIAALLAAVPEGGDPESLVPADTSFEGSISREHVPFCHIVVKFRRSLTTWFSSERRRVSRTSRGGPRPARQVSTCGRRHFSRIRYRPGGDRRTGSTDPVQDVSDEDPRCIGLGHRSRGREPA